MQIPDVSSSTDVRIMTYGLFTKERSKASVVPLGMSFKLHTLTLTRSSFT